MRFILCLICFFPSVLMAKTGYTIVINESGYDLKIEWSLTNYQTLNEVRHALVKSEIISQLSPNVKSVVNTGTSLDYSSLMSVESFGIKSELISKCKETINEKEWSRNCKLQTDQKDGGTYMAWKSDQVVCTKKNFAETLCHFHIIGKTKPLNILGLEILNDRSFAVKAKSQALNNFFKLYYFVSDHNLSTKLALEKFNHSPVKNDVEVFEEEGAKLLKKAFRYERSFSLEEKK